MYKVLRIIFCVLAAVMAAGMVFVFIFAPEWYWGVSALALAFVFAGLMILFKKLQEKKELKENPPPPKGDFITGKVKEENVDDNKNG